MIDNGIRGLISLLSPKGIVEGLLRSLSPLSTYYFT